MNCILYIQLPKSKRATDIDPEYFKKMEHYARMRSWDIVGFVSDEYKDVNCAERANLKNLRHCLETKKNVDAIIVAFSPSVTIVNYAALKAINDAGIHLIIWSNRKNRTEK
jgi:hypothetical protein